MNILFVCTGNAVRSVIAEGLLKKKIAEKKINNISVKSCGTNGSPTFKVPEIVKNLMAVRGVDIDSHVSKRINEMLVDEADIIITMERSHKEFISKNFMGTSWKVHFLREYARVEGDNDILDPMGGTKEAYEQVARDIESYIESLFKILV